MTGSKKKNYNPKSRENLRQFKQPKLDAIQQAAIEKIIEKVNIDREELEIIIPVSKIFSEDEAIRFWKYFEIYLQEFSAEGVLTVSDRDDIATLCKNKILEDRLLAANKKDAGIADVANALDKYKRENQTLKKQLAATRDQRYDPRAGKDVTILDIINKYERDTEEKIQKEIDAFTLEEEEKVEPGSYKSTIEDMVT